MAYEVEPTKKQKKWLELLPNCSNGKEAAMKAGYSEDTANHWRKNILQSEGVQNQLKGDLAYKLLSGNSQLMYLFDDAIKDLAEIISDKSNKAKVRLQADKAVIEQVRKVAEMFGLESSDDGEGLTINIEQKQAQSGETQSNKETINLSEQIENDPSIREAYRTIQRARQGDSQQ